MSEPAMHRYIDVITRPSVRVIVEQDCDNWGAFVPGLGVMGIGGTREEAEADIATALDIYFDDVFCTNLREQVSDDGDAELQQFAERFEASVR